MSRSRQRQLGKSQHLRSQADITLFAHPSDHPFDADLIDAAENGRVHKIHTYPLTKRPIRNLVNSAIYILSRSVVDLIQPVKSDFARDILPLAIERGLKVMVYRSREYVKDMGTPERIQKVTEHIQQGLLEKMQVKNLHFSESLHDIKWILVSVELTMSLIACSGSAVESTIIALRPPVSAMKVESGSRVLEASR